VAPSAYADATRSGSTNFPTGSARNSALSRTPAVQLTIDAASLDTNNRLRDKHLRAADFFDVENHPHVRFLSDSATLEGERLQVRGRLYAAGESMPIDLEATVRRVGDELEVDAGTDADQPELGMSTSTLGMIKTPSHLVVHGRLVRDADDTFDDIHTVQGVSPFSGDRPSTSAQSSGLTAWSSIR